MTEVIVFDLDDTLFPEYQFVISGFRAVDGWLVKERNIVGFGLVAEKLFHDGVQGNIFNRALDEIGVLYNKSDILELVKVYRFHIPVLQLNDDAKWALDFFKDRKLGVITDGYLQAQKNKIKALDLENKFDLIICSDQYGRDAWKPSELPYMKIMESFAVEGEDCLYVGDNPMKDFVTAKKLGWYTVHICREYGVYWNVEVESSFDADLKISTLYELKGIA